LHRHSRAHDQLGQRGEVDVTFELFFLGLLLLMFLLIGVGLLSPN
jgi:hypothetical protein